MKTFDTDLKILPQAGSGEAIAIFDSAGSPKRGDARQMMNIGDPQEGGDCFASRSSFDLRGGIKTGYSPTGPFGDGWYNIADCRHRNTMSGPIDIYGGELAWGMTVGVGRMAFRSRAADGAPSSWVEVWTKSNLVAPATESWANSTFHPKEDQRLRTTDYVTHGAVYSTDYVFGSNSLYTDGYVSYFEDAPYTDYVTASKVMTTAHAVIDTDSSTVVLDLPSAPKAGWGSPNRPILTISVAKIRLMGTSHSIRHPHPSGLIRGINLNGMYAYSGRSVTLNQCGVYTVTMVSELLYLISPFHA